MSRETPVDPKVAVLLNGLLALTNKAYTQGLDEEMLRFSAAFTDEVNSFLDDRRIGKAETETIPGSGRRGKKGNK